MESLKDTVRDKDTTIAKLNMKIKSMENMADKPSAATLPKDRQESNASVKQAVVPKSVLREILQASEKEVEGKALFKKPDNLSYRDFFSNKTFKIYLKLPWLMANEDTVFAYKTCEIFLAIKLMTH